MRLGGEGGEIGVEEGSVEAGRGWYEEWKRVEEM